MFIYVNGQSTQLTWHTAPLLTSFNNPLYHLTYYKTTAVCDNCVSLGCSVHLTLCTVAFVKNTHSRNCLFVIRTIQQSSNSLWSNLILNRYWRSFMGVKWPGHETEHSLPSVANTKIKTNLQSIKHNTHTHTYTGCPRRNVPDFRRVFLMLKYTNITQNTYVQSWTVMEIMAREVWNFDSCYTLTDYQIHIKTGRNMGFL